MHRRYRNRSRSDAWAILGLLVVAALYKKGAMQAAEQLLALSLACMAVVMIIVPAVWLWKRRHSPGIPKRMDGLTFERYIAGLLPRLGFTNVRLTEHYDLGVDIVAVRDGVTWGIQVKHYQGLVKASAVRQVVTALRLYGCERAMVVTNSYFSAPAIRLAESNNCVLIDKHKLEEWITLAARRH